MEKINISVISFANSIPFVYGLQNSPVIDKINLSIDTPSECADKLINKQVDIGIIPIVEILKIPTYEIVSDLCIGADDYVKTVILASNCPVSEIEEIYLDNASRTSVILVQILAKKFWKINPKWIKAEKNFNFTGISGKTGAVIIGDKAFTANTKYIYDLSHEWRLFTGMPFVFAAWVANKKLNVNFLADFNKALRYGITHLEDCVTIIKNPVLTKFDLIAYLKNNIQYNFDLPKHKAVEKFLTFAEEIIQKPYISTSF